MSVVVNYFWSGSSCSHGFSYMMFLDLCVSISSVVSQSAVMNDFNVNCSQSFLMQVMLTYIFYYVSTDSAQLSYVDLTILRMT